jgi:superoxide reductase
MANEGLLLKCKLCGSIIEKVFGSETGQSDDFELLETKHDGEGAAKHVPIIKRDGDNVIIKVGEITHPSENEHYIGFIELLDGDTTYRKNLKPGEEPEVTFKVDTDINKLKAREYCTVHGLWES